MNKNISSILKAVSKPGRYAGGEYGQVIKDKEKVKARFAFCFPDTYEIGMSNLGVRILYGVLNREEDMGIPGLRKAKESYLPHHLTEKCWAHLREDEYDY